MTMKLGMVGLGRMGAGMTERLREAGHELFTYDPNVDSTAGSLPELIRQLDRPRAVWLMIPAGEITEQAFQELKALLGDGDTIVDGGNSNFRDSQRRAQEAAERRLHFVDVGVSGGVWGLREGFCLMAGGEREPVERLEPIFHSLAPPEGSAHGIEYGLMQAYAEGFDILHGSEFELDLEQISGLWQHGSVVRSWLLQLLHLALEQHGGDLSDIAAYVEDSGEGRWTIAEAIAENVPAPVITAALYARFASREDESFAAKINAALREQFGGHAIRKSD